MEQNKERSLPERPLIYYSYYTPVSENIPEVVQQEHDLGRQLLFRGLKTLNMPEITEQDILLTEKEKPCLAAHPEIQFNITHCKGLAACGLADAPIGVDAELPARFNRILFKKVLTPEERAFVDMAGTDKGKENEYFFRIWTLKEAYFKQSGTGVATDLQSVSFFLSESEIAHASEPGSWIRVASSDETVTCFQTKLAHGQILSVCAETESAPLLLEIKDSLI